jgi:ketosteroid isomerase-like protein
MGRCQNVEGLKKSKDWFESVAPNYIRKSRDVVVQFYGNAAVATLYVELQSKFDANHKPLQIRGTVVLAHQRRKWRIVHQHFSAFDPLEAVPYLGTRVPIDAIGT